jgi:putative RNA 2'-phosphotransferase
MAEPESDLALPRHLIRVSKFLSLILRHQAAAFGLRLDEEGFAPLSEVVAIVIREPRLMASADDVRTVVDGGTPPRFEIRGERIRATYGHSAGAGVDVHYPSVAPPALLYHGTTPKSLPGVQAGGLRPGRRQYVHLSTSVERATEVARRRTPTPVILEIDAHAASAGGVPFYAPDPFHFLVPALPARYIRFPEPAPPGGNPPRPDPAGG